MQNKNNSKYRIIITNNDKLEEPQIILCIVVIPFGFSTRRYFSIVESVLLLRLLAWINRFSGMHSVLDWKIRRIRLLLCNANRLPGAELDWTFGDASRVFFFLLSVLRTTLHLQIKSLTKNGYPEVFRKDKLNCIHGSASPWYVPCNRYSGHISQRRGSNSSN
jgi:hypothetical protein